MSTLGPQADLEFLWVDGLLVAPRGATSRPSTYCYLL